MRTIAPRRQDQASQQERQRAAGLVLLLAAVVAGFVLQVVLLPREAQAVSSRRLASAEQQYAAFAPAVAAPRAEHDFLKPRTRPRRHRPAAKSRLGLAQPVLDRTSAGAVATERRTPRQGRPEKTSDAHARPARAPLTESRFQALHVDPDPSGVRDGEAGIVPHAAAPADSWSELADEGSPVDPTAAILPGDSEVELRVPGARRQDRTQARIAVLGPADAREGELVTYAVSVEDAREIAHTPMRLTFDPKVLEFVEAEEGSMLSADGAPTRFQVGHGGGQGVIDVLVSRIQPGRGLTGSGVLFTATFMAHAPGETPILVDGSTLLDATGRRMPFLNDETVLSVRP